MTERFHTFIGMVDYGGPGSGNFGHAGRPGKVGGSSSGNGGGGKRSESEQKSPIESAVERVESLPAIGRMNVEITGDYRTDEKESTKYAEKVSAELDRLQEDYPRFKELMHSGYPVVDHLDLSPAPSKWVDPDGDCSFTCPGSVGLWNPQTRSLWLSNHTDRYGLAIDKSGLEVETDSLNFGGHLSVKGFSGVFRHELGHSVYDILSDASQRDWVRVVSGSLEASRSIRKISEYAASNTDEAFAESFAAYTCKEYKTKGGLPKAVERYIKEMLGA
jgi:hypothetical protein